MGRVEKNLPRSSRSRPVSCLFCRSRKLRCSRKFPCPNCTSRGLSCQLDEPTTSSSRSMETSPEASPDIFRQDVLEGLRRLEEIVIEKRETANIANEQAPQNPPLRTWQKGNPLSATVEKLQASTTDVDWLELEGGVTYLVPTNSLVAYDVEFKTCSIKKAAHAASVFEQRHNSAAATRCIWLPFQDEAKEIVHKYLTDITYIHHVVHIPSVKSIVDDLYRTLSTNHQGSIKLGHVALLLAILASTTFFWTELDMQSPLFSSVAEANEQATSWLEIALDVLEYSRRKALDSLEDVQAMIIVGFMITNLVGVASQAWYVFSNAIAVARRLNLHRIDHPQHGTMDAHRDSIQTEMGRRVWWYLVGTDWQFSQYAGPQKGTYSINPRHMATKKPLNANDEDLLDGATHVNKPMNQPTSMSYSLQRIRLAELCREVTDRISFAESCYELSNYQHIRDVDAQICKIVNEMPSFFSLNNSSEKAPSNNARNPPGVIIQRYVINSLIYALRCRLHLPYLSRAATEPEYGYSREACLKAARMVIRTERLLATERLPFGLARLRFTGVIHCVCMAIIVLLMDVCLHKSIQPEEDQQRRAEIYSAFSVLEQAKGQSPFVEKILESFYAVLRRQKAPILGVSGKPVVRPENDGERPHSESITDSITSINCPIEYNADSPWDPNLPTFDDIWQQFDNGVDPSAAFDWTSLLAELDAPFSSISM
ncbi:hypothetical protein N7488_002593 [Penicillium malachiteum]|nr:hypothetical protein N7488_002593 [Penicillium malachiteum]